MQKPIVYVDFFVSEYIFFFSDRGLHIRISVNNFILQFLLLFRNKIVLISCEAFKCLAVF